ncbi:MAG: rhodanese-like domain-containing protein [Vicinamibacteria bacterium]
MHAALSLLATHGYWVVFVWVLADQAGLPLPSFPLLLASGAVARAGGLNVFAIICLAALASVMSDTLWFEIGRLRGGSVLGFICRGSLEPDNCVGRTQKMFSRRGTWSFLISKFTPGLNIVTSPMAGMGGVSRSRFFAFNTAGAMAFSLAFVLPGYVFSRQLEWMLRLGSDSGHLVLVACVALFVAYLTANHARRVRFSRGLRLAHISAEELRDRVEAGAGVVIVDLRLPTDFAAAPLTLPGAIRLPPAEVARRHAEIPRDRDIVLYCSCPNESTSVRAALLLKEYGITRVRPLTGGYDGWRRRQFPLRSVARLHETTPVVLTTALLTPADTATHQSLQEIL